MTDERKQDTGSGKMLFGAAAVMLTLLLLIVGLGSYFWASWTRGGDGADEGPNQPTIGVPEELEPQRSLERSGRRLSRSAARRLQFELEGLRTQLAQAQAELKRTRDDLARASWKQRIAEIQREIGQIERQLRDGR